MSQFGRPEHRFRCRTCGALIVTESSVATLPRGEDGLPVGECATCGAAAIHDQFADLLAAVWEAEENWRFDDRLDVATGTARRSVEQPHRCEMPETREEPYRREWRCPLCQLLWVKPPWNSAYEPAL